MKRKFRERRKKEVENLVRDVYYFRVAEREKRILVYGSGSRVN